MCRTYVCVRVCVVCVRVCRTYVCTSVCDITRGPFSSRRSCLPRYGGGSTVTGVVRSSTYLSRDGSSLRGLGSGTSTWHMVAETETFHRVGEHVPRLGPLEQWSSPHGTSPLPHPERTTSPKTTGPAPDRTPRDPLRGITSRLLHPPIDSVDLTLGRVRHQSSSRGVKRPGARGGHTPPLTWCSPTPAKCPSSTVWVAGRTTL